MNPPTFRFSAWQMALLVFLVSLCVTPFAYDANLLVRLGRQAWLTIVPAAATGLLGLRLAQALTARFPGQSLLEYAPRVLGPLLGRGYLLLLGAVLLAGAPANLHVLTRIVKYVNLPRTPTLFTAALFTGVVAFGCYFGPEVFARVAEALAAAIAAGLAVLFLAPLASAHPIRLLPLGGGHLRGYLAPSVSSSLGTVRGFLCVLVLGGSLAPPRGAVRPAVLAMLLAALLLALGLAEPVADLGIRFAAQLRFPLLSVDSTVSLRWLPFQRFTALTILVWQMVMYVVLAFYLWSGVRLLSAASGIGHWRIWLIPAALGSAFLGGLRVPTAVARGGLDVWNFSVLAVGVLGPAALLLASRRQERASA